ncbi:uncharacterized protein LOC132704469 [Cylas formicarius]|uniref:uncharacterized protein LOC132704469 n=1 Tax=Cylas formicarius TaxID=197179 RepID=UPI002958D328|nr:uncharacterized protein LOC132704469 [Cylas formicarius]
MYMDDLKIFSNTEKGLKRQLRCVENFSNDIRMRFGLEKCKIGRLHRGEWRQMDGHQLTQHSGGGKITTLDKFETYKYLGLAQARGIDSISVKTLLTERFKERVKHILKTRLAGRNMATAINSYAVPAVAYSFGIVDWTSTELDDLNRTLRTSLTKFRAHHPRAGRERVHLPRNIGGRGFSDLRICHKTQVERLQKYFHQKSESSALHRAVTGLDRSLTPLMLQVTHYQCDPKYSIFELENQWRGKELHGRYPNLLDSADLDKPASVGWLTNGNLFPETEGFMCAIQDQVIPTRSYLKHIIKDPTVTTTNCRICGEGHESVEHLISGCRILAPKDNVAKIVHQEIAFNLNLLKEKCPHYRYSPESVLENEGFRIYWDRTIQTDRTVQHDRPDILIYDKANKVVTLVDVAIPAPNNLQKKEREKREKYIQLADDIKQTWRVDRVNIVPIVIGAMGEIPKSLKTNLTTLTVKPGAYFEMQKSVVLATCNIIRRVLNQPQLQ